MPDINQSVNQYSFVKACLIAGLNSYCKSPTVK